LQAERASGTPPSGDPAGWLPGSSPFLPGRSRLLNEARQDVRNEFGVVMIQVVPAVLGHNMRAVR
jgi:hypothetical protein